MVKLTMIVRLADGLPLCESLEMDKIANMEMYKQQAKVRRSEIPPSIPRVLPPSLSLPPSQQLPAPERVLGARKGIPRAGR